MKTFKLENEPKIESGFITPDHYFDNFSDRVMQQLQNQEPKTMALFARKKNWFYAVAAILVLSLSIPVYNNFYNQSSDMDALTLENYISYHSSVSSADLVNLLDEKDIQKINIDLKIGDKAIENELSVNNDLEQYLLN